MTRTILILATVLTAPALWSANYTFTSPKYTTLQNFTSCTVGSCANFTTAMNVTGTFTTSSPLAANLIDSNVAPLVTSYSFSDGLDTIVSTDANSRMADFFVSTDSSGLPTAWLIVVEVWTSGTSPHSSGDRFNFVFLTNGSTTASHNDRCITVTTTAAGTSDGCTGTASDSANSQAGAPAGTFAPSTPASVPALSDSAFAALACMLVVVGWLSARRRTV